jgi:nicotinate-nucleotide pyrophosphorylase (carboxylating)
MPKPTIPMTRGAPPSSIGPPRTGIPEPLDPRILDPILQAALAEDACPELGETSKREAAGWTDLTSQAVLGPEVRARARLVAKAHGRLAGLDVAARVFALCDPGAAIERAARDGDALRPGQELLRVTGSARALLLAERTALNFVQRMSGIATLTARYVELCGGSARVLDTRKTTPNLRVLEKYAVRCGGGENHRFGLFDEVMVKNNHLDLAGGDLAALLRRARGAVGPSVRITAEARDEKEALQAVEGGADVVLLDNLGAQRLAKVCPLVRAKARELSRAIEIEASGGIDETNLAAIARSGVDRVSVGALTHSAPALDLALYLERAS